jgi:hypothetical protein
LLEVPFDLHFGDHALRVPPQFIAAGVSDDLVRLLLSHAMTVRLIGELSARGPHDRWIVAIVQAHVD